MVKGRNKNTKISFPIVKKLFDLTKYVMLGLKVE